MHRVSIVKCNSYKEKEVNKAVAQAIDNLKFKIRPKSTVLLKPNVLFGAKPSKAITTHPAILNAVCRILKEKKCRIIIGESFGTQVKSSAKTFQIAGLTKIARRYKARLLCFSADKLIEVKNDRAVFAKKMLLPKILSEVNLVINLPKFKTHSLMMFTGAVKNLFGCIAGGKKQAYHAETGSRNKFAHLLLDIYLNIKPGLNIMDAVVGMEGNGPANGNPINLGFIMASDDAIAMDMIAEQITKFKGKILTNKLARKRRLIDKRPIGIVGAIPNIEFRPPDLMSVPNFLSSFFLKKAMAFPKINKDKCRKCWTCVEVCPVNAMKKHDFPKCSSKECIACYCCQEMCPYDAIELKQNAVLAAMMRLYFKFQKRKK